MVECGPGRVDAASAKARTTHAQGQGTRPPSLLPCVLPSLLPCTHLLTRALRQAVSQTGRSGSPGSSGTRPKLIWPGTQEAFQRQGDRIWPRAWRRRHQHARGYPLQLQPAPRRKGKHACWLARMPIALGLRVFVSGYGRKSLPARAYGRRSQAQRKRPGF